MLYVYSQDKLRVVPLTKMAVIPNLDYFLLYCDNVQVGTFPTEARIKEIVLEIVSGIMRTPIDYNHVYFVPDK